MSESPAPDGLPSIDPKLFWPALGSRAVGAAVVAARGSSGPAGFLALSVTHLTANPPTLIVSIGKSTSALATILEARHFAVNYLCRQDEPLAEIFSGRSGPKGAARFEEGRWTSLRTGAPALATALGTIDCALVETIERYETVIALGRVVDFTSRPDGEPLVHFRGRYGQG